MRLVSILGDSISTYEGYNPAGYAAFYEKATREWNGLSSVYDTWWAKVNGGILGKEDWIFPKKYGGKNFDDYNAVIRRICRRRGCHLADLESLHVGYETLDGTHPTKRGHEEIAAVWLSLLTQMGFIARQ